MSDLQTRAELIKLAHLLGVSPDTLAFAEPAGWSDLRRLREQMTTRLFEDKADLFHRLARASRLVPGAVNAKIAEKVFGPLLSARVAGYLPPDRAVDMASRLPIEFLADLTLHLAPARATEVLRAMPAGIVVEVAQVMLRRHEFITMARFVDTLTDEQIRAVIESINDEESLLRVSFYVESLPRLNELVELLPAERLKRVAQAGVTGGPDLQAASLALISHLDEKLRRKLVDITAAMGDEVLTSLLETARRDQLWAELAPLLDVMTAEHQARLAEFAATISAGDRYALARVARDLGVWERIKPLHAVLQM